MKFVNRFLVGFAPALLKLALRRIRYRAANPGPADITPGITPPAQNPEPQPSEPMKVNLTAVLALVAGVLALLVSPEVAPLLPETWTKVVAALATATAAFAPKAIDRK